MRVFRKPMYEYFAHTLPCTRTTRRLCVRYMYFRVRVFPWTTSQRQPVQKTRCSRACKSLHDVLRFYNRTAAAAVPTRCDSNPFFYLLRCSSVVGAAAPLSGPLLPLSSARRTLHTNVAILRSKITLIWFVPMLGPMCIRRESANVSRRERIRSI